MMSSGTKLVETPGFPIRRMQRRWLTATTAIAGFIAFPAYSQTLPGRADVGSIVTDGRDPGINRVGSTLTVSLNARNTIINWDKFDVPENTTANFERALLGPGGALAVLNRDTSSSPSQVLGRITSDPNVSVWVINGSGIIVGKNANINTGSLVMSTLDIADADFLDGNNSVRLFPWSGTPGQESSVPGQSVSAITVLNGANIKVEGGNRGLIMVAPMIDAHGTFNAVGQDVAFVTASDVNLTFNPNSPLSVQINRGTAVKGNSQFVRGKVTGADALFALASQDSVTDALLRVDADVTMAAIGKRGIVLSVGRPTTAVDGVTVAASTPETGGIVGLAVGGNLTTNDTDDGSDILAGVSGSALFGGTLSSKRDITLASDGDMVVENAVTAGRNYTVTGSTVQLGKFRAPDENIVQKADGLVAITASRALSGVGRLTLQSNANGSTQAPESLTLAATFDGIETAFDGTTTIVPSGTINFGALTVLRGGTDRQSSVRVLSGATDGSVTLGKVFASTLLGAVGTANPSTGIVRQAAVATDNLSITGRVILDGTTVRTGSVTSGEAVLLTSTAGDMTTGAIDADRNVGLVSAGAMNTGAIDSGGTVLVNTVGDAVFGGTIAAVDDLVVRAGSINLRGATAQSGGTIDLTARVGGISAVSGLRLTSTSTDSADSVRLQAAGPQGINLSSTSRIVGGTNGALNVTVDSGADGAALVLGDVTARSLTARAGGVITTSGSQSYGTLNLAKGFAARSTTGDLRITSLTVTDNGEGISLSAPVGSLVVQSTVRASGDVSLVGGSSIDLDTVESLTGTALVTSSGLVDLDLLAGARGASATGKSVDIDTVRGGTGPVSIGSTSGGLTLGKVDGGRVTFDARGGDILVKDTVMGSGAVTATATGAIRFDKLVTAIGGNVRFGAGTGEASVLGGVSTNGDYSVSGASVTLGGSQAAGGAVTIEATAGRIIGQTGLRIAADTDNLGAETLTLNATGGGIALGGSTLSAGPNGQSAVTVTTDSGDITLGDITAKSLTIAGSTARNSSIVTGDLRLIDSLSANAGNGVRTGTIDVSAGGVSIDGGTEAVETGRITATDAVSLTGGLVTHGDIMGRGVTVTATSGTVDGGAITSSGGAVDVVAAKGSITLGTLRATGVTGNVTLTSAGTLTARGIIADGTATLSAANAGADVLLQDGLTANGAVLVGAGRNITAPFIRSLFDTLTINAPNGSLGGFGGGVTDVDAGPGKALTLNVGNSVALDDIGGGAISISAASITAGAINAGANGVSLVARSGDLTVLGTITAGDTNLTATGTTSLQSVFASGTLTVSGGTGLGFENVAGTDVSVLSNGAIAGDSARATGALTITGGSVILDHIGAGGNLSLIATNGNASLSQIVDGLNVSVTASGRAAIAGNVTARGGYAVTGSSVALGSGAATQRATGPIAITARSGDIVGAPGLRLSAFGTLVLDSAGAIALSGSTLDATGPIGLRAGAGNAVTLGNVATTRVGGYDGTTVIEALRHSGSFTAGDIVTQALDIALSAGNLATGRITASGATALAASAGSITTGVVTGASVNLNASLILSSVSVTTSGASTLAGSEIRSDAVRAGSIDVRSAGTLRGLTVDRTSLTSTAGDITAATGDMALTSVDSAGAVSLDGRAIDIAGKLTAARQALVKARSALTMGDASAAGDLTLAADGALRAGALVGGGAVAVKGQGVQVGNTRAGTTLALTSGADLSMVSGQANGAATIDATGLATLGALSAAPSILIRSADAALTGTQRATSVTFENRAAATTAMRIGDTSTTGGFGLSNAEMAMVSADTLRLNQGAGAMQIGTLTFGADTGRRSVEMLTTGAIDVDGTVIGSGLGRTFRIGGDTNEGSASRITVTATSGAGGRLLFDNANLDLRGDRIAIGLARGFVDVLTPDAAGSAQAQSFLNNGNSPLYNATLGGGIYDPAANTLVSAYSLAIRFADFALIQNTGLPGRFSGVTLGGTLAAPATSVLTVRSTLNPPRGNFAMFGTINGVGGSSASLLGSGVIDIDPRLLGTSRINGCLAGSGVGCLTTIVIQPALQTFEWDSEDVFGVAQDVSTPFNPVVGGNNEELLTGLPELAPAPESSDLEPDDAPALAPSPIPVLAPAERAITEDPAQ